MKVSVFIDNSNIFKTIKKVKEIDNRWNYFYDPLELGKKLAGNRELVAVKFYCVHPPAYLLGEDEAHKNKYIITERYYAAIEKLPLVEVKYGDLKGGKGDTQEKNLDTQLSSDLVADAALSKFDVAILVSNDGDYVSAAKNAKQFGKKIEVIFFRGRCSMNLKQVADINRRARLSYFQKFNF